MSWQHKLVDGRYRLEKFLGQGGMAKVFLAHDIKLKRNVALKVLPVDKSNNDGYLKRFQREFDVCSSLNHPNIVKLFSCGRYSQGQSLYYTMEILDCGDLEDFLEREKVMEAHAVEVILKQLVSAFDCFHAKGIVHRDLKLANLMLDNSGRVVITDFGLVYNPNLTKVTKTGALLGTPAYLAPEMIKGEKVTRETDYFQLGIILYKCLTGEHPFRGSNLMELAISIGKGVYKPVNEVNRSVPKGWNTIIDNCLAVDRDRRYSCGKEVLSDLEALHLPNEPLHLPRKKKKDMEIHHVISSQIPTQISTQKSFKQRSLLIPVLFLICTGLLSLVGYSKFSAKESDSRLPPVALTLVEKLSDRVSFKWSDSEIHIVRANLADSSGLISSSEITGKSTVSFSGLTPGSRYNLVLEDSSGRCSRSFGFTTPVRDFSPLSVLPTVGKVNTGGILFSTSPGYRLIALYGTGKKSFAQTLLLQSPSTCLFQISSDTEPLQFFKLSCIDERGEEKLIPLDCEVLSRWIKSVAVGMDLDSSLANAVASFKKEVTGSLNADQREKLWCSILLRDLPGFGDYVSLYPFISLIIENQKLDNDLEEALSKLTLLSFLPDAFGIGFPYSVEKCFTGHLGFHYEKNSDPETIVRESKGTVLYESSLAREYIEKKAPYPEFTGKDLRYLYPPWMSKGEAIQMASAVGVKLDFALEYATDIELTDVHFKEGNEISIWLFVVTFCGDYRFVLSVNDRSPVSIPYGENSSSISAGGLLISGQSIRTGVNVSLPKSWFRKGNNKIKVSLQSLPGQKPYTYLPALLASYLSVTH